MTDPVRQPFVREDADDESIWLEPTSDDVCWGLCIATGATLAERIAEARDCLKLIASQLDELESGAHRRSVRAV